MSEALEFNKVFSDHRSETIEFADLAFCWQSNYWFSCRGLIDLALGRTEAIVS